MESCVKNCGVLVHEEVATRGFMEELRELVKRSGDDQVKGKVLEMIQNWGMAFRNSQKYRIVTVSLVSAGEETDQKRERKRKRATRAFSL